MRNSQPSILGASGWAISGRAEIVKTAAAYRRTDASSANQHRVSSFCLAALLFFNLSCAQRMQVPITDQEKHDLEDIAKFNQRYAKGGYQLSDRLVTNLNLSGLRLEKSAFTNVRFEGIDVSGAMVLEAKFDNVDFSGCDLSHGTFENVQFNQCDFTGLRAGKARFEKCLFLQCHGTNMDYSSSTFTNCKFDQFTGANARLAQAALRETAFLNCKLLKFNFFETELVGFSITGCQTSETTFSGIVRGSVRFDGGAIVETGFDNASFMDLSFQRVSVTNVSISHVQLSLLTLVQCPVVQSLRFTDSTLEKTSFDGCPNMIEPAFYRSTIRNLCVTNSTAVWCRLVASNLEGDNSFRATQLEGLDFSRSRISNLLIADSKVLDVVLAENTTFNNVKMRGTVCAPALKVRDTGATYVGSDRFTPSIRSGP